MIKNLSFHKLKNSPNFYNLLLMALSLVFFIKITADVVTRDEITLYDKVIVNFINTIASTYSTVLVKFITNFGSKYLFVLLIISVLAFVFKKCFKQAVFLLSTTLGGYLITQIIKDIVDRARPVVGTPIYHAPGYSFPSGHALVSTCFYGALIFLINHYVKDSRLKNILTVLLALFIVVIGFSRVYLGVHYPSDVLAGFSFGIFWVSFCSLVYKNLKQN